MNATRHPWLVIRALYELVRYDVVHLLIRDRSIHRQLAPCAPVRREPDRAAMTAIGNALLLACCLYCKPVRCLQRSVCLVRLLRRHGVPAQLLIGYRPAPFFSHAWVEVDGHVINDSSAYRAQLRVLLAA
jgi:hypothetical protein